LHNLDAGDDLTLIPDRIMKKRGFGSSCGQGSQDDKEGMRQHTTNQSKPVKKLSQATLRFSS
jgi:hypothetical protein